MGIAVLRVHSRKHSVPRFLYAAWPTAGPLSDSHRWQMWSDTFVHLMSAQLSMLVQAGGGGGGGERGGGKYGMSPPSHGLGVKYHQEAYNNIFSHYQPRLPVHTGSIPLHSPVSKQVRTPPMGPSDW